MTKSAISNQPPSAPYDFYSKREYFAELQRRFDLAGSGSRILLMSMSFDPSVPEIAELMTSLEGAAARGADVTLGIDANSFMRHGNRYGPLWFHSELGDSVSGPFRPKLDVVNRLNTINNARAIILNRPSRRFSIAIAGRSHIKTAVIDDYFFVGCSNLDEPDYVDLMVGHQNAKAASELYTRMSQIIEAGNSRTGLSGTDQTIIIDEDNVLLIDSGIRGQSVILDTAHDLIDSAGEWVTIMCPFFPNSVTAQRLLAAVKRHASVEIHYPPSFKHGPINGLLQLGNNLIERSHLPASMFENVRDKSLPFMHVKLLATENGLIIGSHNLVRVGVQLGTAEIALYSKNPKITAKALTKLTEVENCKL